MITDFAGKSLRYNICVSGAAAGKTVQQDKELAIRLGRAIAKRGHILTTGATVGLPYYAAVGAKQLNGFSVGFSPASSLREHLRKYRLPQDTFDFINFTGMNYVGRDLYLVQSSDALITIGGRFGSLHEFTSALEADKPCGILTSSGGAADVIPELMRVLEISTDGAVIYEDDPEYLVQRIVDILDVKTKDIREQLLKDEHWYLRRDPLRSPPPRAG